MEDLNIHAEKGSMYAKNDYVEFACMYMDTDDAERLVDELGDKVEDFGFYFEDYGYGDKWRYTKQFGIEGEEAYYKSDVVHRLHKAGYSPAEVKKIVDVIF
ncbi:hypothetical protein [uncultured Selenomonas sp.]|uniref:hypothetical protein n=1 Tax=uncultured Selenomonas sp. TaxID=159275 RepID=UPI0025D46368|nr:hypothetical protein [uncultured Selenomonas sp.]